jgi:Ni/Fe-hydrogenase b-type cytochrome subunit
MNGADSDPQAGQETRVAEHRTIYRHRVITRLWHWTTAIAVIVLIGSGLGISNAHPHLYWGQFGANYDSPWLSLPRFPGWLTIPSTYDLALARRWHLLFALVLAFALLCFMVLSLFNRHIQRDLRVRARELTLANFGRDVRAHLAFRFHDPEHPGAYNLLQKLSYVAVIFVLLPLLIRLALSPGMNAAWPWLLDLFGGRASARSLHFIAMVVLTLFVVAHLVLVILAGVGNELRSMVTGRWRTPEEDHS